MSRLSKAVPLFIFSLITVYIWFLMGLNSGTLQPAEAAPRPLMSLVLSLEDPSVPPKTTLMADLLSNLMVTVREKMDGEVTNDFSSLFYGFSFDVYYNKLAEIVDSLDEGDYIAAVFQVLFDSQAEALKNSGILLVIEENSDMSIQRSSNQ